MGAIMIIALLCLWASARINATPFLSSAPSALTSLAASASASASNPVEPLTHIADLRVKQRKAEQLRAEKQVVEEDVATYPEEEEEEEEENNEAAPSLLQKKINKILTKLRIISGLSNKANARITKEEEVEELDRGEGNSTSTEDVATFQKVIYPRKGHGAPIKLRLKLNESEVDDFGVESEQRTGRLEQVGVFFAELLGSIVALAYGAVAQINNSVQGTTAASLD